MDSSAGPNVPVAEVPIVVVPGGELLHNPSNRALLDALGLFRAAS
jgi:hypothetical protein